MPRSETSGVRRRQPVQPRGGETVHRILDAAASLLETGGIGPLSTNRIAESGGVNISVLYRYFANKFEILEDLSERTHARIRVAIEASAKESAPTSLESGLTLFIDALDNEPGLDALSRAMLAVPELRRVSERPTHARTNHGQLWAS